MNEFHPMSALDKTVDSDCRTKNSEKRERARARLKGKTATPLLTQEKGIGRRHTRSWRCLLAEKSFFARRSVAFELRQAPPEPVDGGGKLSELAHHTLFAMPSLAKASKSSAAGSSAGARAERLPAAAEEPALGGAGARGRVARRRSLCGARLK